MTQKDSAASFAVVEREWPADDMPFTLEGTPIELAAKGRRVPEWQLDRFGLVAPLEESPVKTGEPVEPIRLVPMGAARLRISAFPVAASGGSEGHVWSGPPKPKYRASASHCFENDSVEALCDDVVPGSSEDRGIPRFTFWPRQGTTEWVRYDFEQPRKVSGVEVYWFDDTAVGGGCGLPASWRVLTRQGDQWKPVAGGAATEAVRDRFQEMSFEAVETTGCTTGGEAGRREVGGDSGVAREVRGSGARGCWPQRVDEGANGGCVGETGGAGGGADVDLAQAGGDH